MGEAHSLLRSTLSRLADVSPIWWAGFFLLVIFARLLHRTFMHPLRKIPGPPLAKVTELWRTGRYLRGRWHEDILECHRKYGPVVRLSPNEVSIVSPDLVKTVFGHSTGSAKTGWYDTWLTLGGGQAGSSVSFFGATNPTQHGFLRKRVSATYSMSAVVSMEGKIQPMLDTTWDRFDEFAKLDQLINLSLWASYFTYDVVGTLCLSEPMGFLRDGYDKNGFISGIHGAFYWISNLGYLPLQSGWLLNPVIHKIARLLRLRLTDYARAFTNFSINKVIQRMQGGSNKSGDRDMLDHFVDMKGPRGEPAPLGDILAEVGNLLAAGADTTSVAIKAVLGPLLKDPARYARLRKEVDAVFEARNGPAEGSRVLSYNVLKDLPFLTACIKEGERLHPSIIYQLPRVAPADGFSIEGYYIPPSATISMSPLAQNRCQAIFGNDADTWRPERWIPGEGNSAEIIKEMDKQNATFGYGSRTYVGRNLATFEVYKFIAQLITRYNVELLNPSNPWTVRSSWFAEMDNLHIRLKRRGRS
ncbi:hypothetical protein ASPCAL14648 [Aspergillus calidoustus]|uniref:Cytochrome P450 n=1 Tax=Aspergillus calidoustus TaxID=454130 RepID=A0A0U5GHK2_ASPCI|nr:hypothetical protein ASPCAL14648 [Aspergillus calidoustus]